jgi:competence protein ComEC
MSSKSKIILVIWFLHIVLTGNSQTLKIYHIDVDQADATLFIMPNGSTLLVDAGKNGHGIRIKKILQSAGITRIDHFVNTHYHEDHYGGIDELVLDPEISVTTAYDRGDKSYLPASKLDEKTFKDYQSTIGKRAIPLTPGTQIPIDPSITVTCISQGGKVLDETGTDTGLDENDMSLSVLVKFGGFTYFVGGDIESHTENKIAERDLVMNVDVYQANHHGSHSSSSSSFMQDLNPDVVIISNGNNESYYHPRQVTLDKYSQLSPPPVVFQTNKYLGTKPQAGNVPDEFIADLDAVGDDGYILITVDLSQRSYKVSYRDLSKTFHIKNTGQHAIPVKGIVIEGLLPNPQGDDVTNETVTIRNKTSSTVALTGWVLKDASGRIWTLDNYGQILSGQSLKISRNGMPMSLNNDGDIIFLLSSEGLVIDDFSYVGSAEGIEIHTGY